ncbi:MAG: helix-turn-helix domain-containing protein [Actinomycetales bacterium]|nr:helix-turn-helix domain-containing protein [Actinomycetales bacterium]
MTDIAAPESRDRIRGVLQASEVPVTVEQIAEQTGLHPNTVRGHLDVLIASGSVVREPAGPAGRGRPKWLYSASGSSASAVQFLAEALSAQLARADRPSLADQAAKRWADALPTLPKASDPDEAVAEAADALNRLGFTADVCRAGVAIDLTDCPYADLVDENPVICDIHTALVIRLLEQTGQPVTVESMDVWARPGLCRAHLNRPDLQPAWTIRIGPKGTVIPPEGEDT